MKRIIIIAVLFIASCTNEQTKTDPLKKSIRVVDSVMTVSSKEQQEKFRLRELESERTFDSLPNDAFEY